MQIILILTGVVIAVWVKEFFSKNDPDEKIRGSAVSHVSSAIDRLFK